MMKAMHGLRPLGVGQERPGAIGRREIKRFGVDDNKSKPVGYGVMFGGRLGSCGEKLPTNKLMITVFSSTCLYDSIAERSIIAYSVRGPSAKELDVLF
jgi:hypothetical protein